MYSISIFWNKNCTITTSFNHILHFMFITINGSTQAISTAVWLGSLLSYPSGNSYQVYIGGSLICNYNKNYDYHVTLFEDDLFFDEAIGNMRSGYGHGTVGFHIERKDNYFELYLQIIHNCNSYDRPFNTYYNYIGNFRITGGEYTRTYNINITNAGWKSTNVAKRRRLGYAEFNNESSGLGVPLK
ncbi:hypothetical protein L5515_016901 [Caenorhabditis briggsae]|uniref:Uncharacterized protein n=1 Tax=Caenorhabditis briggsae TaxID=6238 RepID=A0AAE9F785_CAEBR|nr:hypothetical protein L5515_016901 [Caenorhabditis briggsae]